MPCQGLSKVSVVVVELSQRYERRVRKGAAALEKLGIKLKTLALIV